MTGQRLTENIHESLRFNFGLLPCLFELSQASLNKHPSMTRSGLMRPNKRSVSEPVRYLRESDTAYGLPSQSSVPNVIGIGELLARLPADGRARMAWEPVCCLQ